jgi:hypothetical protein
MKPEGSWELNLSRKEERIVAKTLIGLVHFKNSRKYFLNTI